MGNTKVRLAAGVLVLTRSLPAQFLLMKHVRRWDLPKGHSERGETPRQTALREMTEETGIAAEQVELDPVFEYVLEYSVQYRGDPRPVTKRVHYYLAWIAAPCEIRCTEHPGAEWVRWQPPHQIQQQTIDPLLAAIEKHLQGEQPVLG